MKKIIITLIIILILAAVASIAIFGPRGDLQIGDKIKPELISQLTEKQIITPQEILVATVNLSPFSSDNLVGITKTRVFMYSNGKLHSIPIADISSVVIRDTYFGHQQVLLSAKSEGALFFEIHTDKSQKLLQLLDVKPEIVKNFSKTQHSVE